MKRYPMLERYDELIAQRDGRPPTIAAPITRATVARVIDSATPREGALPRNSSPASAIQPAQLDLFGGRR